MVALARLWRERDQHFALRSAANVRSGLRNAGHRSSDTRSVRPAGRSSRAARAPWAHAPTHEGVERGRQEPLRSVRARPRPRRAVQSSADPSGRPTSSSSCFDRTSASCSMRPDGPLFRRVTESRTGTPFRRLPWGGWGSNPRPDGLPEQVPESPSRISRSHLSLCGSWVVGPSRCGRVHH